MVDRGAGMAEVDETPLSVRKAQDFAQWYLEVIDRAGLIDKRYPIKGMKVWTGYGWKVIRLMDDLIRAHLDADSHQEVNFPLLIPQTEFAKEADHIKGFGSEVYWVTRAGDNDLDVPLLLRPTSETAMYPMFSLWVRSHADLPLRTYQLVNTFRYETKATRTFIREREIHFFEAHTCHADFEDAEAQVRSDLQIMETFAEQLALPYRVSRRPEWDKFAGADYSLAVDAYLPSGRTLQVGSIHQYRENFSRPYNIAYETADGARAFVHQTTYGMSERLLGAIVGLHGDDRGLVLPPLVAPIQVVMVPIFRKHNREEIVGKARALIDGPLASARLRGQPLRIHLDDRDIRPGPKFFEWELKGVPLRVEVGPRDLDNRTVLAVRRSDGAKQPLQLSHLAEEVVAQLMTVHTQLLEAAAAVRAKDEHHLAVLPSKGADFVGIATAHWCGAQPCALRVEELVEGSVLGARVEQTGSSTTPTDVHPPSGATCVSCGGAATKVVSVARTY